MPRIAVDAMGGDNAPIAIVSGSMEAAKKGIPIVLFGKKEQLLTICSMINPSWQTTLPISIVDCPDIISMDAISMRQIINQKTSSMYLAVDALKKNTVVACVSAGNSAAMHTLANVIIGRIPGVLRAALASVLPSVTECPIYCVDLGANTDCKAVFLEQFAHMAAIYVKEMFDIEKPRVGLLSNGHEPYKGSSLVKETYQKLAESNLHFIGNIEARDIFDGHADILVCDGFAGNVMLKTAQGTLKAILHMLAHEANKSLFAKIALKISSPIFSKVKSKLDYAKSGGALLLGIRKPVFIAHGSSNSKAIENAILFAHNLANNYRLEKINNSIEKLFKKETSCMSTSNQLAQENVY
ncbi:phosphate acyltransferase PlsX [Candidatus Dependentiae bacterium]|nr:MAG: phosphate acyltransferase PlsX [Candidatus Dependentiae bacterium]